MATRSPTKKALPLGKGPPVIPSPHKRPASSLSDQASATKLLSPNDLEQLHLLKRRKMQLTEEGPPADKEKFVPYRLACVRHGLEVIKHLKNSLRHTARTSSTEDESELTEIAHFVRTANNEQDELELEERMLIGQSKLLEQDIAESAKDAESAYIEDLYYGLRLASSEGQKEIKRPVLARRKFRDEVTEYYGGIGKTLANENARWCVVIKEWILVSSMTVAHIIPKSFDSRDLAHLFGAGDAALASARNGIVLNSAIEKAFDNSWVAIIPFGSPDAAPTDPTEFKIVLLNEAVKNDMICHSPVSGIWRWQVIDGRKLQFLNDNRPARRYLYFRYAMAMIHAELRGWKNARAKIPPGPIWASPGKPDGYLRKSVLRSLCRRVLDEDVKLLTDHLTKAGTFDETVPSTGNRIVNETCAIDIGIKIRRHERAEDREEDKEVEDEEEEEDEAEAEEDEGE